MHCYICNVMNRILQLFSCFLLTLHLGIPVVLQADHGHFLGKYWNEEEQLESDACCPSETHKPLDRTDNCPLCQRALTSFGTLAVCSAIPQTQAMSLRADHTSVDPSSQYSLCVPLRGPPFPIS